MGFDLDRFEQSVDSELKCAICCGVFDQPVQANDCEHIFCHDCIQEWLSTSGTCPIDRRTLTPDQLKAVPRVVRNMLNNLVISCDFRPSGCERKMTLDQLETHKISCNHNPDALRDCPKNCGAMVTQRTMADHNCVRALREVLNAQITVINDLRSNVSQLFEILSDNKQFQEASMQAIKSLEAQNKEFEQNLKHIEQPIQQLLHLQSSSQTRQCFKCPKENRPTVNCSCCQSSGSLQIVKNRLAQEVSVEVYIANLQQIVPVEKLRDYVSKQDVTVLECKLALNKSTSNDYRLTVSKIDAPKLLKPELWPYGVSCFIAGRGYETRVYGNKSIDSFFQSAYINASVNPSGSRAFAL